MDVLTLLDTGFEGYLILPQKFGIQMKLKPSFKRRIELADGNVLEVAGIDMDLEMPELNFQERVEILLLDQSKALFGISLLKLVCQKTKTDFVISYTKSQFSFRLN